MANYTLNYSGSEVDALLNKIDTAFGEETVTSDTITWDGDISGKDYSSDLKLCRVSNVVLTAQDVTTGKIATSIMGEFTIGSQVVYMDVSSQFGIEAYAFVIVSSGTMIAAVVPYDCEIYGVGAVRKGLYFGIDNTNGFFVTSLTLDNYQFERTEVTPIDTKYLPSEGRVMFVDITGADLNSFSFSNAVANKSYIGIKNMVSNGAFVVARVIADNGFVYAPMTSTNNDTISFVLNVGTIVVLLSIAEDNSITGGAL